MTILLEDDVRDQINEQLEYAYEDEGIGTYEWHGSKENDVCMRMRLTDDVAMVEYTTDKDEMIYVNITGYLRDIETDQELDWVAELESAEYDHPHYVAKYKVYEV